MCFCFCILSSHLFYVHICYDLDGCLIITKYLFHLSTFSSVPYYVHCLVCSDVTTFNASCHLSVWYVSLFSRSDTLSRLLCLQPSMIKYKLTPKNIGSTRLIYTRVGECVMIPSILVANLHTKLGLVIITTSSLIRKKKQGRSINIQYRKLSAQTFTAKTKKKENVAIIERPFRQSTQ